jgi:hypothetical protein
MARFVDHGRTLAKRNGKANGDSCGGGQRKALKTWIEGKERFF